MTKASTTRRAALLGGAAAAISTSAAAQTPFGNLINRLNNAGQQQQPQQQQQLTPEQLAAQAAAAQQGRQSLAPLGYALGFAPVRQLMSMGDFGGAMNVYRNGQPVTPVAAQAAPGEDPAAAQANAAPRILFSTTDVFLSNAELGMMNFDSRNYTDSTTCFAAAHDAVTADQEQESGSTFQRLRRQAGRLMRRGAAFVSGRDEIAVYVQKDYERILQLNYLALSYLVPGDRRAYNVNRLAIEEQDLSRRTFEEELGRAEERLGTARNDATNGSQAASQTDSFQREFEQFDPIANRVTSAYVNPLGYYLSGVIQEISSTERPSLRGNARNSYTAALELARTSPQITAAVQAMQAPPVQGQRILHLVIGEGFAPSRQALQFGINTGQQVVPVRIPIFTPTPSSITRVQLSNARGQPVTRLDAIGDVEALVMRSQRDRMPQMLLGVIASAWRASAEQRFAAGMGGFASAVMQFKQSFDSPDMRSWASLPAKFHVARVVLPPNQTRFRLDSYAGNRVVHTQTIEAPADLEHCVVYGRTADGVLSVEQPRRLWIDAYEDVVTETTETTP